MRSRLLLLAFAALIVLTGSGGSCSEGAHTPTTPVVPDVVPATLPAPELRLAVVTDLMGMLEPCGCTSRPLGGIDGLAAALTAARAEDPETLVVTAGDLFFGATHPADLPGAETQELWRAELVADLLSDFRVAAGVPGTHDVEGNLERFDGLRARARFPLLGGVTFDPAPGTPSAEVPSPSPVERAALPDHVVVSVRGVRVGLVGISTMAGPQIHAPSDPVRAAETAAAAARAEGATLVVVLSTTDRRTAHRIATLEAVDLVIEGARDEAEVRPPGTDDGAPVIAAGRHGQGLVIVDLFGLAVDADGRRARFRDVSTWSRTVERDRLVEQAAELRTRLDEWRAAGRSEDELAEVRGRLTDLDGELARVVAAPASTGPRLSARHLELPPEAPRDAAVRARMDELFRRVNVHNREAFASHLPAPAPEGAPHYVGTTACGGCHEEELTWWRSTLHGHAYDTLVHRSKEYNLDCVGCHVTGYEMPGGSTVSHVGELRDVGCETCHGPGSLHIADPPNAVVNVHRAVTEDTCLRCHTPEHSDLFNYATYRTMMITAEHGGTP